jgi:hypothetical protein
VIESRTLYLVIALLSAGVLLNQCSQTQAQEGTTITMARVNDTEQRWRQEAVVVPGPAWGPALREPVPEAPRPRQDPIQKVIAESSRCTLDWHSQRAKRPSRITCWR